MRNEPGSGPPIALIIGLVVIALTIGVAGTGTVAAQESLAVTVDAPQEATVGDQVIVTSSISVPELARDYERELQVNFYSNGQLIGATNVTITDGETTRVEITHTFEDAGDKNIKAEATVTLGGQEYTGSDTTTLAVSEPQISIDGAAFTVPESLQDEVQAYRANVSQDLQANTFVLATQDKLYIVFTKQEPTKGLASVEGRRLNNLSTENLTFSVVAATNVSFDTTGTETTVQDVAANSDQYRLDLVRITANYRRLSTLTDPDEGANLTLSTTSGILVSNPETAATLFDNVGGNARTLARNTSAAHLDAVLRDPRGPHLHTFSFETKFWADAEATVDAIVLDPQSAAQQFINEYDQAGVAHAEDGAPILYVVEEDFHPQRFENISSVKSRADSLDGTVVEVEARLFQERISVQETIEHNTGCGTDLLEVQTPEGPVCVNVVQDNLLHSGVAWNSIPQSRNDGLFTLGVSSRHQDVPNAFKQGRYRIQGEVVSSSRVNESLPQGSVLLIYELERVGKINDEELESEARDIVEARTDELTTVLRQQIDSEDIEMTTDLIVQFDTNGQDGIQPGEAQAAIVALNRGEIGPREAQAVIAALNAGG